ATGTGTTVTYTAPTATDLVDGARTVNCLPASGTAFSIATTTVTCTASDASGNTGTASFHVAVRDSQPPVVHVPPDITVHSTGALTNVSFGPVTATDGIDGELTASCSPASPGPFPVGVTHVDCVVDDAHGNRGSATFNVTVQGDVTVAVGTTPVQ